MIFICNNDGLPSSSTAPGVGAWVLPGVIAGFPHLGSQVVEVAVTANTGAA